MNEFVAVCLVSLVGFAAYKYMQSRSGYWTSLGIKGVEVAYPFLGELYEFLTESQEQVQIKRRKKSGKLYGSSWLGKRGITISDPEVLRQICIRDFDCFVNHSVGNMFNDYHKNSLFWLQDDHWRRVRALTSPSFTSGKIKRMYKLLDTCADDLVDNLREHYEASNDSTKCLVDLFDIYGTYTIDGISQCCFGIKLKREDKFQAEDPSVASRNSFIKIAEKLVTFDFKLIPNRHVKPLADRVQKIIDLRRQSGTRYDDLLQMLIDAKSDDAFELSESDQKEDHHACLTRESMIRDLDDLRARVKSEKKQAKLDDFAILCEAMLMMAAGFHTTRSSMSTMTFFLAYHPEIQAKLHEELKKIALIDKFGKVQFDYEMLTSCDYLDAVVSEGLRRFPPAAMVDRVANTDYFIEKYKVHVPKGMSINIGLYAMHMDPDYWQEPERFDPERFLPGQKENIVPGSYAPFLMGPRHCIGMRFSLTETKLGLAKAVMNFKFEPVSGVRYPPVANQVFGAMSVKDCRVFIKLRSIE